jgi:photosystem II stability/assembly factor-like uncharacterized protein
MNILKNQHNIYFFLFYLAVLIQPLQSQQLKWVDISGIQGCYILREGADGKLFAVSEPAVYSSSDAGYNWELTSLNRGVMIDFVTNKNYALLARYIPNATDRFRLELSTDNGLTWQLIYGNRAAIFYDQFMLMKTGAVYALNYQGYLSLVHFNGTKWDTIYNNVLSSYNYDIASTIDSSSRMYVAAATLSANAVLVSTDFGVSWNASMENRGVEILGSGKDGSVFAGRSRRTSTKEEGFVYRTTDGGATWSYLGLSDHSVYSLSGDKDGNVYASTEAGVYSYRQLNSRWEFIGPQSEGYDALLISESGNMFTSAGTCKSSQCSFPSGNTSPIYSTANSGIFWSPSGPRKQDLFCMTNTSNGGVLAGTLGGRIFRTESGGLGWTQLPPGSVGDYVYSLYTNGDKNYSGTDKGLFVSTDNGNNWSNLTNSAFTGSVYSFVKANNGQIFIGTNFGLYASSDIGLTWVPTSLYGMPILFLAKSNNNSLYAVSDKGAVYSSSDNGTSWNYTGLTRDDIQAIEVNDAGNIFLGLYGGIMRSIDSGATWNFYPVSSSYVYSITFNAAQDVFAGTYNGVYQSRNNGSSWTFVGLNSGSVLSLMFDSTQNLIAGIYQNGVYRSEQPVLDVKTESSEIPASTKLYPNFPNPFNPFTTINFAVKNSGRVKIIVYNTLGQALANVLDEIKEPGSYSVQWNGSAYASGLYFYRMEVNGVVVDFRKMILMK